MKLLLDTHALIWWAGGDAQLSAATRETISDAEQVWVSVASVYEMAFKHRLGKLPGVTAILKDLAGYLSAQDFAVLQITLRHAEVAASFPLTHRDPFDRLLIAQAQLEGAWLVSNETLFDHFGLRRLW